MAKGIAGGFPLGAFALSEDVSAKLEAGDHGGTYCGNPLACAVGYAVVRYLLDAQIATHVAQLGREALAEMARWREMYPGMVVGARGRGLLLLVEFHTEAAAAAVAAQCLAQHVFVRQTQGTGIRVFPALNITHDELMTGLAALRAAIAAVAARAAGSEAHATEARSAHVGAAVPEGPCHFAAVAL